MTYTDAMKIVSDLTDSIGRAKDGGIRSHDKVTAIACLDKEFLSAMDRMDDTDADAWPALFAGSLALAKECEILGLSRAVAWVRSLSRLVNGEVSGPASPPTSRAGQTTGARTPRPADPDQSSTDAGRIWIPVSGIQSAHVAALQEWILANGAADKAGSRLVKSWRDGLEQEQARAALAKSRQAAQAAVTRPADPVPADPSPETPAEPEPEPEPDHTAAYLATVESRTAALESGQTAILSTLADIVALVSQGQARKSPRPAKVTAPAETAEV